MSDVLDFDALAASVLRWDLLGLQGPTGEAEARQAYREAAKSTHPDLGGDAFTFQELLNGWHDICEFMGWPK